MIIYNDNNIINFQPSSHSEIDVKIVKGVDCIKPIDMAFIFVIPVILSVTIYIFLINYWNELTTKRFLRRNTEGMIERLDLFISYYLLAIMMEVCIFIILKLDKEFNILLNDRQAQVAVLIVLTIIFISRISSTLEREDPLKPVSIFMETSVIIILINIITNSNIILLNLSFFYKSYYNFVSDFLNFSLYASSYTLIGVFGLILIGEPFIKFIIKYFK